MQNKLLLTAVFGPYGVRDEYGEDLGCQMELLNNQITREQGAHSPRQSYWSFGLYLMAENVSVPATVLDFPTWKDFVAELEKGYTHVGISFIVPNVLKAKRMAEYVREHYPDTQIILGGYGTVIPDLEEIVPHDAVCTGEGVRWLREYFGEDADAPLVHPALVGPAYEYVYGYQTKPKGGILMPGLGCENGCTFCITSHKFNKRYVPLLKTGKDVFEVCRSSEEAKRIIGFSVMDENFLKQPERARELLAEMEKANKPYVFDLFSSAEVVQQLGVDFLVRLGVRMLWIGVESKANRHEKTKGIDLAGLIRDLQANGIVVQASSILFQDHHDPVTIQEDIDWVIGLGSNLTQFMNYTPYPTTSLYRELDDQGRLNDLHYRHQHGQGRLNFDHPHFPEPKDHVRILRKAFRKKFRTDGPGVLNMALTAIAGYRQARKDLRDRNEQGLAWNPETLRYENQEGAGPDRFMKRRVKMMRSMAIKTRPVLLAAWVFAPNREARAKARRGMRLFAETFGKPRIMDTARALGLIVLGFVETFRFRAHRLMGAESIVRQPPVRLTAYRHDVHADAETG
ncbi:MAG: radical SAM protein [bacterium]|nr:radical SAM protein [bacterium]